MTNNTNIYQYIESTTSSTLNHISNTTTKLTIFDYGIAPRPLPSTELHRETVVSHPTSNIQNNNDHIQTKQANKLPLAAR